VPDGRGGTVTCGGCANSGAGRQCERLLLFLFEHGRPVGMDTGFESARRLLTEESLVKYLYRRDHLLDGHRTIA
jgi:hypothetical protein